MKLSHLNGDVLDKRQEAAVINVDEALEGCVASGETERGNTELDGKAERNCVFSSRCALGSS